MGMIYELDEIEKRALMGETRPRQGERMVREPLEEYHRRRDALLGLNSDHFNSPNYGRGAVRRVEKRTIRRHRKLFILRIALTVLFLLLWCFVWTYGLLDWSK